MNERPKIPVTVVPLLAVAVAGLIAQALSAYSAFGTIASSALHAAGAAAVIEGATVVEALVFVRSRNRYAALGLLVTMLSSATYNYTQAARSGAGLGQLQLIAMAVGPLAALISVGLALGDELRKYEGALVEWQAIQDEIAQEEAATFRRETIKAEREAEEQKRWERQLEQQQLTAQIELEQARQAYELKEKGLALRRAEKRERQETTPDATVTQSSDSDATVTPRWRDKTAFVADTDRPLTLTTSQLSEMAQVSPRTAQRWLAAIRSDNGKDGQNVSGRR